jgi:hypothetical protein
VTGTAVGEERGGEYLIHWSMPPLPPYMLRITQPSSRRYAYTQHRDWSFSVSTQCYASHCAYAHTDHSPFSIFTPPFAIQCIHSSIRHSVYSLLHSPFSIFTPPFAIQCIHSSIRHSVYSLRNAFTRRRITSSLEDASLCLCRYICPLLTSTKVFEGA